jgi:hypothetical protein
MYRSYPEAAIGPEVEALVPLREPFTYTRAYVPSYVPTTWYDPEQLAAPPA